MTTPEVQTGVLRVGDVEYAAIDNLANRYGLTVKSIADGETITGSFWGEPEAGIKGLSVFVRSDTPIHSMLHEISHIIQVGIENHGAVEFNLDFVAVHSDLLEVPLTSIAEVASFRRRHAVRATVVLSLVKRRVLGMLGIEHLQFCHRSIGGIAVSW